jgi:PPOX class probable F420-dependent enzyme
MNRTEALGRPDRRQDTSPEASVFAGRYVSITSFKRDGTGVATPVWFVQEGGRLLVQTDVNSGKVKRIRRNPHVTVAPCTATGRLLADPVPARVELLGDAELDQVERLMARKYRIDLMVIKPIRSLQAALHRGRAPAKPMILAVMPA